MKAATQNGFFGAPPSASSGGHPLSGFLSRVLLLGHRLEVEHKKFLRAVFTLESANVNPIEGSAAGNRGPFGRSMGWQSGSGIF